MYTYVFRHNRFGWDRVTVNICSISAVPCLVLNSQTGIKGKKTHIKMEHRYRDLGKTLPVVLTGFYRSMRKVTLCDQKA